MKSTKNRFIVIEGLEGAGKTTTLEAIRNYLLNQSQELIVTREPGGTELGERVRVIIKEGFEEETLNPTSELLLLYAARVQLLSQVIQPALARGHWVLSDRFELSTFAYQGGGRGVEEATIERLSSLCLPDCRPGLIIFLDINPELGFSRIKARGQLDRMEQEPMHFYERVYQAYHKRIQTMDHVCVIDASQSIAQVEQDIQKILAGFMQDELCTHV